MTRTGGFALAALALAALALASGSLHAQNEAVLKSYFEGRVVTVKIAMPGTEHGVDIYPETARPLEFERYADRLKDFGTAIRSGESAMVTKVRVKSKHIEFQLGGGGYGTAGDETSSSVSVPSAPKTKREKDLEAQVRRETDSAKKRALQAELDDLRAEREREDARNRAAVAEAEEQRTANIRQRRLEGGSRFNVRYKDRVPGSALTPVGLKAALAEYVDFGDADARRVAGEPLPDGLPRKGMLLQDADARFGPARTASERKEGRLTVVTRVYPHASGSITAEFVEGVLFRYSIASD